MSLKYLLYGLECAQIKSRKLKSTRFYIDDKPVKVEEFDRELSRQHVVFGKSVLYTKFENSLYKFNLKSNL